MFSTGPLLLGRSFVVLDHVLSGALKKVGLIAKLSLLLSEGLALVLS